MRIGGTSDVKRRKRESSPSLSEVPSPSPSNSVVVNVKDEFKETYLTHLVVKAYVFDTRYENAFAADLTRRIKKELARRDLTPADARFGHDLNALR